MDQNEIIALGIVVLAALLAVRYFIKQKGGGCCGGKSCLPSGRPKEPLSKK
jgi:hypothetical protein